MTILCVILALESSCVPQTVKYEGRSYTFPDDATDDEIAEALDTRPAPDTGADAVRSFGSGLIDVPAGIVGLPGDIERLYTGATDLLGRNIERAMGTPEAQVRAHQRTAEARRRPIFASTGDVNRAVGRTPYQPRTTPGEWARTFGQFAPAAAAPGGLAARITRAVIPAIGSEAAGQLTKDTPIEPVARFAGGLGGGIATEAGLAAQAARSDLLRPRGVSVDLERRFGPLTRGERSGDARARLEEDDWRRGTGGAIPQAQMQTFDARRAPQIRERAMRTVTRGLPPISEDAGEAGVILADQFRTLREQAREQARGQYERAFELSRNDPVPPSDELLASVDDIIQEHFLDAGPARSVIARLQEEVVRGGATHATVERARQQLNRLLGSARRSGDDAQEFAIDTIVDRLDEWQAGRMRNPDAVRAMDEARGIFRDMKNFYAPRTRTELSTGHMGRADPGGRAIEKILDTDVTGEQVIDAILGAGRKPTQASLGAVRRLRDLSLNRIAYTNRNAASGVRVPGRPRVGGQTTGARRFQSADQLPYEELQALREGLMHRVLAPLDEYISRLQQGRTEGGMLPAQTLVSNLDNALNGKGRELTELMFTPRDLSEMRGLLAYLQRLVPPPGTNVSGTGPALGRALSAAGDRLMSLIPIIGPASKTLNEAAKQATINTQARRATEPLNRALLRGPEPYRRSQLAGPLAALSAGQEINIDAEGNVR